MEMLIDATSISVSSRHFSAFVLQLRSAIGSALQITYTAELQLKTRSFGISMKVQRASFQRVEYRVADDSDRIELQ